MARTRKPRLGAVSAEYIFLDIVGYSKRSIESQTAIIAALNHIVRNSLKAHRIHPEQVILLPTGDGMCIALLNVSAPYDCQVRIALAILERLHGHNLRVTREELRFQIRVGINANRDNIVIDINGNRNVTGAGINESQRVMSKADGSQILVGDPVYRILKQHDEYASAFKYYPAVEVKHGLLLDIYQFIGGGRPFLNVGISEACRTPFDMKRKERKGSRKGVEEPASPRPKRALRTEGLRIRVEIGPSNTEIQLAKLANVQPRKPLRIMALLDTGASVKVINPQVALTCGLRQTGEVRISSAGLLASRPEFVGAIHFPDSALRSIDPIRLVACPLPAQDVACVIGRDVLEKWRLVYDGRTGEVQIEG